ncbi:MAG: threonylcarbamoyl-AMP synthase [Oscillospiraceae bacterium]|jgi:L-threonylcarbamoyladenylate synthase|nr:threonylcarbamoyl-AMP synthase [Oscillospiraceae bacterium]
MINTLIRTDDAGGIAEAARLLKLGGVVAVPTETVYGLAGCALCPEAIEKIFAAKGRPRDNPLIVHVSGIEMARELELEIPPLAERLAERFWAGPLTMIFKKNGPSIPAEVSCGLPAVAVRVPAHRAALDIIKECGFPLAAPSANVSGAPSPTSAKHVYADLKGLIPLIIDGGECEVGIESTVVAFEGGALRVLRPGAVTAEQLREFAEVVIDEAVLGGSARVGAASSPGTAHRHYSPKARVTAIKADASETLRAGTRADGVIENPDARTLFARLREFDDARARDIYIRLPETSGIGLALYDRIIRAAGFNVRSGAREDFHRPFAANFGELNIIGLTGMSGAGKTAAARIFAQGGYRVIDCDLIARRVISRPGCAREIGRAFPELYGLDGVFDRKKAARELFSSPEKLKRYEKIVYPYVIFGVLRAIGVYSEKGERDFLMDAPTLFQSGADDFCRKTAAVVADESVCVNRVVLRDGIERADALRRLGVQPNADFFKEKADYVIENNGDFDLFAEKIRGMVNVFKEKSG